MPSNHLMARFSSVGQPANNNSQRSHLPYLNLTFAHNFQFQMLASPIQTHSTHKATNPNDYTGAHRVVRIPKTKTTPPRTDRYLAHPHPALHIVFRPQFVHTHRHTRIRPPCLQWYPPIRSRSQATRRSVAATKTSRCICACGRQMSGSAASGPWRWWRCRRRARSSSSRRTRAKCRRSSRSTGPLGRNRSSRTCTSRWSHR